jgi:transmembrane 9 superfamily protein 1
VWGHRAYTLFGILSLAFLMLLIVTAFITIALTYFQLSAHNYHWWWRAFFSGCATGVFMYAYAAFYYVYRSEMTGTLQAVFFFGYMLAVSYAFALMLGAISFYCALRFVKHIYLSIKSD